MLLPFLQRTAMNDVMTGTADPNSVFSSITLAAFADMGWYQVDMSRRVQRLKWGDQEGCSFVQGKCNAWNSRYFVRDAAVCVCFLASLPLLPPRGRAC